MLTDLVSNANDLGTTRVHEMRIPPPLLRSVCAIAAGRAWASASSAQACVLCKRSHGAEPGADNRELAAKQCALASCIPNTSRDGGRPGGLAIACNRRLDGWRGDLGLAAMGQPCTIGHPSPPDTIHLCRGFAA